MALLRVPEKSSILSGQSYELEAVSKPVAAVCDPGSFWGSGLIEAGYNTF
jgi:hypothetical protein